MTTLEVGHAGALLAGLLSFISPCVLPLVPAYLCFLGGVTVDQLTGEEVLDRVDARAMQRRVMLTSILFVAGFITVFVLMGATATTLGRVFAQHFRLLGQIAGGILVVLGLNFMGLLRIPWLDADMRFHVKDRPAGLAGAYLIGLTFAFGWTPCVGPVLAGILMVASASDSVWQGVSMLTAYGLGMGIPFLLAALAAKPFLRFMARMRSHMRTVKVVIGTMLVLTGLLIFFGSMSRIGNWLLETFPGLGIMG